jgi:hypothetical protein
MITKNKEVSSKDLIIYLLIFIGVVLLIVPEDITKINIVGKTIAMVRIIGLNSPYFDHGIGNYTIYQNDSFFFDVNCSDIDIDDLRSYSTNFTGFDIDNTTGIINKTLVNSSTLVFNQSFVDNNTIEINCTDSYGMHASSIFVLEILDINEAPVLSYIGPQIATEGSLFLLDIDATDPENDILLFNDTTTLFQIGNLSGVINFTPSIDQIGNYTINISVYDGEFYDYEVISFKIVRGPYCGDSFCGSEESCANCSNDCGSCPAYPATKAEQQEAEAPAAVQSGGGVREAYYQCQEKWECSDWSVCSLEGYRARTCIDINNCGITKSKPPEMEECVYQPTCFDGMQNGGETGIDCGGSCEPCLVANCFDGIQNCHDNLCEEGIDCGGSCEPCEAEFAKIPAIEIPGILKLPREFPWLLILLIAILLTMTITGDQIHLKKIKKKEFEQYKESMRKYRPIRRKIYKFVLNIIIITSIASLYIYYFSNDAMSMIKFVWFPILLIVLTPICVSYAISRYTYYDYMKSRKEEKLKETHKRELLQLVKIENELLFNLEMKLKKNIYDCAAGHKFDSNTKLYSEVNPIYGDLSILGRKREERIDLLKMPSRIVDKTINLIESETLKKAAKDFPEFMAIINILKYIEDNKDMDTTDKEDELLEEIEEISLPYMKTVLTSKREYIHLYNDLVELYEYYTEKHKELTEKDEDAVSIERKFTDKIKGIAKKADIMKAIQENPLFASMYNTMVDLFNHYVKKMELRKAIKGL